MAAIDLAALYNQMQPIINGGNSHCKIYYNLNFDYIHFYDGRNQDIALGYDFDNKSVEF